MYGKNPDKYYKVLHEIMHVGVVERILKQVNIATYSVCIYILAQYRVHLQPHYFQLSKSFDKLRKPYTVMYITLIISIKVQKLN